MQIDLATSRSIVELQRSMTSGSVGLTESLGVTENSTDFGSVLSSAMSGAPVSSGTTVKLGPGVTWEDGLLWQQLGTVEYQGEGAEQVAGSSSATAADLREDSIVKTSFEELITAAGEKYGVPTSLIKAVIDTESSFNPNAVSSAGAKGLMQLMDGTARGLGVSNSFDPAQNIDGGAKYLSYQLQKFGGEIAMALAAYNAGPSRVTRLGVSSDAELIAQAHQLPSETQAYIRKVMNARTKYEV
ncbi:lytic transglycosylase domain-containing protein [Paenibacillus sp. N3/727]|uniref:lytic transglycosylase domain-containing protein n=1 Tax=Paenibacillus sp. N3/727 TaxID=2925845 RepID=UPI001F534DC1|nr:lytic transglycosylase domain-containing protein [Paenibacillus sp. N3/727]UNK21224.1 lytic transglycosylase domain-containing protein [Paenibacillus sp. N3/727]